MTRSLRSIPPPLVIRALTIRVQHEEDEKEELAIGPRGKLCLRALIEFVFHIIYKHITDSYYPQDPRMTEDRGWDLEHRAELRIGLGACATGGRSFAHFLVATLSSDSRTTLGT